MPGPRLPAEPSPASQAPGVAAAVGDVSFPVGAQLAARRRQRSQGHGWASAALTPYRLVAGHAPSGPRDVVVDSRLGSRRRAPPLHRAGGEGDATGSRHRPRRRRPDRGRPRFLPGRDRATALRRARPRQRGRRHRRRRGVERSPGWAALGARRAGPRPRRRRRRRRPAASSVLAGRDHRHVGGIAGFVAMFVVAGTFALVIAQRRRETAVLRALGATPRQVRRLIATEALFVSLGASALGLLAGRPFADGLVDLLAATATCRPASARALLDPAGRRARDGRRHRPARGRRGRPPRRPCAPGRGAARGRDRARRPGVVRTLIG